MERKSSITEKSREEFNKELINTLQKIVHPSRLNKIYDRVISFQTTQQNFEQQKYILSIIKDYLKEIDLHLQER